MKAIQCAAPLSLGLIDLPDPVRRPGEVLLAMKRAGICGTDMHIYSGNQPYFEYPRVIGHELSAEVIEADKDSGVETGDLVYINPYIACGTCVACRQGRSNCCASLSVLGVHQDGGLVEYLNLPRANVVSAEGLDADQAAMVEFLAVGAHAVARAAIAPGQRILVTGGGPIGIGVALFAHLSGGNVSVLDMREERLAFCSQHLGVETVVADEAVRERLLDRTDGEMFDAVFDATGSARAMESGFFNVAHGGIYTLVSIVKGRIGFEDPEFHKRETTLLSSRNALPKDFETVADAIRNGEVPTGPLNTHRVSFADIPERMGDLTRPETGTIKALVEIA